MDYKVGDRVFLQGTKDGFYMDNLYGIIASIDRERYGVFLIDFSIMPDVGNISLHNGSGLLKSDTGWWVNKSNIKSLFGDFVYEAVDPTMGTCFKTGIKNVEVSKKWERVYRDGDKRKDTIEYKYPICLKALLKDYVESEKDYQSRDTGIIKTGRTFGVELECVSDRRYGDIIEDSNSFFFLHKAVERKDDGSLKGRTTGEFVTPILKGKKGEDLLKRTCTVLEDVGYTVNSSCGTHVHIGIPEAKNMRKERSENAKLSVLFELYAKLDDTIRKLIPEARRSNTYCQKIVGYTVDSDCYAKKEYLKSKRLDQFWYNKKGAELREAKKREARGRYCGINFAPLWRRGALEIRYNHGTLDYKEILHWTAFHSAIVELVMGGHITQKKVESMEFTDDYKNNLKKLFSLIDPFLSKETVKEIYGRYKKYQTDDIDTDDVYEYDEYESDDYEDDE